MKMIMRRVNPWQYKNLSKNAFYMSKFHFGLVAETSIKRMFILSHGLSLYLSHSVRRFNFDR